MKPFRTPSNLGWVTPPEEQGQISFCSYASSYDGTYWCKKTDMSIGPGKPGREEYFWADATDCGCKSECFCFDPANRIPLGFDWHPALPPVG